MKKFHLTILFVVFSALTIGAGAVAVNIATSSSAEKSLIDLAEAQSRRDAQFLASVVSQLLATDPDAEQARPPVFSSPASPFSTAWSATPLILDGPSVLAALQISGAAIYDLDGRVAWVSAPNGVMRDTLSDSTLRSTLRGEIVSGYVADAVIVDAEGRSVTSELVYTFVPLIGEQSGAPVRILGVSREVPEELASLLGQTRSTVLKTTLISLSGVFLILLAFIISADRRIWKRNEAVLGVEREQKTLLGERNEELSRLNQTKSNFLAAISHELSAPLASAVSFVDLVLRNRDKNLSERQLTQLQTVRRNGQQMARLVSDLSDASRVERGGLEILPEEFPIDELFADVRELVSHMLNGRGQSLVTDIEIGERTMVADRGRLLQVVSNLVSNASKYSPPGATVTLKASAGDGRLEISVIDEGAGISGKDKLRLFEMFFRGEDEATRSAPGTGIGLVLVKEIVEKHGGTVEIESELGAGTTATVRLPLRPGALRHDRPAVGSFQSNAGANMAA